MVICKTDQIKNPDSKKCVSITGALGKILINKYLKGEILLESTNVEKLKILGIKIKTKELNSKNIKIKLTTINELNSKKNEILSIDIPECNQDMILNPLNQKCVNINSETTKNLIKSHKNGKIILKDIDIQKLINIGLLENNPESLVQKKCFINTILNPLNNECVNIYSETGKALIKAYKKGEIILEKRDIEKLINMGLISNKNIEKVIIKTIKNSITKKTNDIPDNIKALSKIFVKDWQQKQSNKYMNKGHELYCKTKNINDLTKPKVNLLMNIEFLIKRIKSINPVLFNKLTLDTSKQIFISKKIKGISLEFNNYSIRNLLQKGISDNITYFEDMMDYSWLTDMNNYISNLSTKDIYTLIGYTHLGDVIANNYMRNTIKEAEFYITISNNANWSASYYPLFFQALIYINSTIDITILLKDAKDIDIPININIIQLSKKIMKLSDIIKIIRDDKKMIISEKYILMSVISRSLSFTNFWEHVIKLYIMDLNNIIRNAPPLRKPLIVYRGVKNDYFLKGNKGHVYKTDSFVSTSINLGSALRFSAPKCCFKRITLLPGTRTLLLAGISKYENEFEILLGSESLFYITKDKNFISKITTDVCNEKINQIIVTDMVVIK